MAPAFFALYKHAKPVRSRGAGKYRALCSQERAPQCSHVDILGIQFDTISSQVLHTGVCSLETMKPLSLSGHTTLHLLYIGVRSFKMNTYLYSMNHIYTKYILPTVVKNEK